MERTDHIISAPFIGISRHRFGIDGQGVTTLVAFHGCPLRCQHCINRQCWDATGIRLRLTPEELLEQVKIDSLYFQATKGGICFGGGEPMLYHKFISRFRDITPNEWRFTIETSLNVPPENLAYLIPIIDEWIVDIKDMEMATYLAYTGTNNLYVLRNLCILAKAKAQCLIRVPLIPGFNTNEDVLNSAHILKNMGFTNFDFFTYTIKDNDNE